MEIRTRRLSRARVIAHNAGNVLEHALLFAVALLAGLWLFRLLVGQWF